MKVSQNIEKKPAGGTAKKPPYAELGGGKIDAVKKQTNPAVTRTEGGDLRVKKGR